MSGFSSTESMADSITRLIYRILRRNDAPVARVLMATWVAANGTDPNLSKVRLVDGTILDWIPKNADISSLSANDPVLLIRGPGVPYTILCKVIGDITVATV